MKTIYKLLNPPFLRRLDEWLLGRYPVVWRTRGHYVLFYALLAAVVLFVAGFCWPVSVAKLTIDPIKPIVLGQDVFYILPMVILSFGLLYWAYRQYQAGFPFYQVKQIGATLLIYTVCFYMVTAVAAPAFKLGALVRTAWFLMDEADLKYWEDNDFFAYGFLLKDSDTLSIDAVPSINSFFKEREGEFRKLRKREDFILENRYNSIFIDTLAYLSDRSYLSDLSDLSDRSYLSYRSDRSDRSYLSDRSYRSYRSYRSDRSYRSYRSDRSYLSYRSYRSDRSDRSYLSDLSDLSDLLDLSYLSSYEHYYHTNQHNLINKSQLEKYAVPLRYNSIKIDTFTLTAPRFVYQMEDAIRSVRHARQYLAEWIIFRHARASLLYLPLLACLIFAAPFMAFRPALTAIGTAIAGWMLLTFVLEVKELDPSGAFVNDINILSFALLPLTGLLMLLYPAFTQKQSRYVAFAFHLIVTGLFVVVFSFVLDLEDTDFAIYKPVDIAFFGVQAIGVAGAILMAYIQKLPKRR
ncbi:MAG: hypothetical protein HUU01_18790 [Saprospiraceae bacterium]|nr:hypothetical protein [Saprospiraceae bacterium]